jgi:hypothetical protein
LIGWMSASGLIPGEASGWVVTEYVLFGLAVAALSFFLLFAGIGGFDTKVVDGMVNLVAAVSGFFGVLLRFIQTGKVQTYLLFVLFGVLMFFLWSGQVWTLWFS